MTKSNVSRTSRAKSGGKASLQPCSCCGIAPDPMGRPLSVTFEQPDVIFEIHPELLDTWGEDPFLAIKGIGFFVRVVLPVRLTDGFAVDFGTWLEVHSEDFRQAWRTWNFPEYKDLVLEGYLGNEIAPWGSCPMPWPRRSFAIWTRCRSWTAATTRKLRRSSATRGPTRTC